MFFQKRCSRLVQNHIFTVSRAKAYFGDIDVLAYDTIKEDYFDKYGFDNMEEKGRVNDMSLAEFYRVLSKKMDARENLLIEYPFNKIHVRTLQEMVDAHAYRAATILLTGDWHVLYERATHRDLNEPRNPGHLAAAYHKGTPVPKERVIPEPDFDTFVKTSKQKIAPSASGRIFPSMSPITMPLTIPRFPPK